MAALSQLLGEDARGPLFYVVIALTAVGFLFRLFFLI